MDAPDYGFRNFMTFRGTAWTCEVKLNRGKFAKKGIREIIADMFNLLLYCWNCLKNKT